MASFFRRGTISALPGEKAMDASSKGHKRELLICILLTLCGITTLYCQQNPSVDTKPDADKATLQLLLKRVDELEERIRQLEAEKSGMAADSRAPRLDSRVPENAPRPFENTQDNESSLPMKSASNSTETEPAQADNVMSERMDMGKTLLKIRGFGDISLHGGSTKGDNTSFSLGQLDLFVSSDISDKYKFLSEIVFEAGPNNYYGVISGPPNTFGVDIERYLLVYSRNDYFNLTAGRGHTAIGYYNTAYHHSTWLQTTTGRPFLFDFEDHGGILPIHLVGVSASGIIPSGRLGLHYVAEIGNQRESRNALVEEPVTNEIADTNHKAFNVALFARPEAMRGFQSGVSLYHDVLAPANAAKIGETILAAHAVLIKPKYEWLSEAVLDRHVLQGSGASFNTPAFYTQLSRQYGLSRPYIRYQYLNAANYEPLFPDVALRHGPSIGLRFDASESVALKLQYDYTFLRAQPGVFALSTQVGFTF
jgi:hypothetical protein